MKKRCGLGGNRPAFGLRLVAVSLFALALLGPAACAILVAAKSESAGKSEKQGQETTGREDLDRAVELKLSARTLNDLGEVIKLCEQALSKGLEKDDAEFARQLLAGTRIQRGLMIAQVLLRGLPIDRNWPAFRALALEDLEKGLAVDPGQPEAWLAVAKLQALPGGDQKKAAEAASRVIEMAGDNPQLLAEAYMLRGDLTQDNDQALADLTKAIELRPDDPVALRLRGQAYLKANQAEKALADFEAALEKDPDSVPTLEAKIDALLELERFEDAEKVCDQIEKLSPNSAEALFHRARVAAVKKEFEKALEILNRAAKLDPKNPAVLMIRAAVLQELKKTDEALQDVNEALKLRPGNPALLRLRAAILAGSGKFSEAIADLEEVRKTQSAEDEITLTLQLGLLYSAQKFYGKAVEQFTKVLEMDPKNVAALRGRGDALLSMGRQAEAIKDYEKALEIDPNDSGILNNLAWVLATSPDDKLRDGKRALELAKKACELTQYKEAHILSTLAAAYAELGDLKTAIEWSQKAVELGEGEEKEALQKELETYKSGKPMRELLQEPPEPITAPDEKEKPKKQEGEEGKEKPEEGKQPGEQQKQDLKI